MMIQSILWKNVVYFGKQRLFNAGNSGCQAVLFCHAKPNCRPMRRAAGLVDKSEEKD